MKILTSLLLCSTLLNAVGPQLEQSTPPRETPSSYMQIEPHARALDYEQAFEQLRKEKTAGKVYFLLTNGTSISNIIDMTLMPNSTLILFRYNSPQGIKLQTVKVEEIVSLHYQ